VRASRLYVKVDSLHSLAVTIIGGGFWTIRTLWSEDVCARNHSQWPGCARAWNNGGSLYAPQDLHLVSNGWAQASDFILNYPPSSWSAADSCRRPKDCRVRGELGLSNVYVSYVCGRHLRDNPRGGPQPPGRKMGPPHKPVEARRVWPLTDRGQDGECGDTAIDGQLINGCRTKFNSTKDRRREVHTFAKAQAVRTPPLWYSVQDIWG